MTSSPRRIASALAASVAIAVLAGCQVPREAQFPDVQKWVEERTGKQVRWKQGTEEDKAVEKAVAAIGATLGVLPLRSFKVRFKNERTDRLILATESGTVVCIRERSRPYPLYHMFPESRPIIPEFEPETPEAPVPGVEPEAPAVE